MKDQNKQPVPVSDVTALPESDGFKTAPDAIFRTCMMAAPVGIGFVKQRVFQWTNARFQEMVGYTDAELRGRSSRMVYEGDEEFERVGEIKYRQIRRTGFGQLETRIRRKDGTIIDTLLSSAAVDPDNLEAGTIFTCLDISDRKQAERALAESERRYKLAIAAGKTVVWDWRPGPDTFYVDDAAYEILGYDPKTRFASLQDWLKNLHPDDMKLLQDIVARTIRGDLTEFEITYRLKDGAGEYRWLESRGHTLTDSAGSAIRVLGTTTDISERQAMQDELREKDRGHHLQMMHADRLVTIGRLAAGVAHEINNPLSVLYGSLQELASSNDETVPIGRDGLDRMLRTAQRIKEIVHNLLVFSRQRPSEKIPHDINEVAQGTLSHLSAQAVKQGVSIRTDWAEDLPRANVNAEQLQQVVLNLMFNAMDAMPDGGKLEVSTERQDGNIVLEFADSGKGIEPENLSSIFTPFFTTKEVGGGTGLGLSISYGIVKDHGGTIEVESSPGKGAKFVITLPGLKAEDR
jgi:PAS domain S-box-containing protein